MRSFTIPVAVATLLVAFVCAAPAATQSAATQSAATTTTSSAGSNIIVVPTGVTCGGSTTTASPSVTPINWIPTGRHQKACEAATFTEPGKDDPINSADWEDCAALYSLWSSYNGTFNIGSETYDYSNGTDYDVSSKRAVGQSETVYYAPILKSGSCTFGLHTADVDKLVALGDVDIYDILKTALNEYSSGSLLAVRGGVKCAIRGTKADKAALKWQLYYPGA